MYIDLLNSATISAFAQKLMTSTLFTEKNYSLFTNVPLKCLTYGKPIFPRKQNLSTIPTPESSATLDFVVCSQSRVLIGIALELCVDESTSLFQTYLPDFPVITFGVDALACDKVGKEWDKVYDAIIHRLESTESTADYLLHAVPVNLSDAELAQNNLLCHPMETTPYGQDEGLFFKFQLNDDHSATQKVCTTSAFLDGISNITLPVTSHASQAAILTRVLDTPLSDLFHLDCDEVLAWKQQLEEGQFEPVNSPDAIPIELNASSTYADLLHSLMELDCAEPNLICVDDSARITWRRAIPQTALLLCSNAKELRDMPLDDYFKACCQLRNNRYPLWLFQTMFANLLNTAAYAVEEYTVGTMLSTLSSYCFESSYDAVHNERLLLTLLLQPLFQ